MKRSIPLNLIVLAMLVSPLFVANSVAAAPLGSALASADTIRQTDTFYVHIPVTVYDTVYDTIYNPVPDLNVSVDTATRYGKVSGSGAFPDGTEVEIAAIPYRGGYTFLHWDDGSTENPRTVTISGDMHFTATFGILPGTKDGTRPDNADTVILRDTLYVYLYDTTFAGARDTLFITPHDTVYIDASEYFDILVLSGDEGRGVVAGNGTFLAGTVVEIGAVPLQGFRFVHWHDNNRDNPRRVLMDDVQAFVAEFVPDTGTYIPDPTPDPEPWNPVLKYAVSGLTITVTAPASTLIRVFTPDGRLVAWADPTGDRLTEAVRALRLPQNGVYLVQVGSFPVKRFVLM